MIERFDEFIILYHTDVHGIELDEILILFNQIDGKVALNLSKE